MDHSAENVGLSIRVYLRLVVRGRDAPREATQISMVKG